MDRKSCMSIFFEKLFLLKVYQLISIFFLDFLTYPTVYCGESFIIYVCLRDRRRDSTRAHHANEELNIETVTQVVYCIFLPSFQLRLDLCKNFMKMSEEYELNPIVIDNGSYMMKAGFGGDDDPRHVFRTVIVRIFHNLYLLTYQFTRISLQ